MRFSWRSRYRVLYPLYRSIETMLLEASTGCRAKRKVNPRRPLSSSGWDTQTNESIRPQRTPCFLPSQNGPARVLLKGTLTIPISLPCTHLSPSRLPLAPKSHPLDKLSSRQLLLLLRMSRTLVVTPSIPVLTDRKDRLPVQRAPLRFRSP